MNVQELPVTIEEIERFLKDVSVLLDVLRSDARVASCFWDWSEELREAARPFLPDELYDY